MGQPINTALQNSIIEMFEEGHKSSYISTVLKCNVSHVSVTISSYLLKKQGVHKRVFEKPTVQPFVLITNNERIINLAKSLGYVND